MPATREKNFFGPGGSRGCDQRPGCLAEAGSVSDDHPAERLRSPVVDGTGLDYRPDVVNAWGVLVMDQSRTLSSLRRGVTAEKRKRLPV